MKAVVIIFGILWAELIGDEKMADDETIPPPASLNEPTAPAKKIISRPGLPRGKTLPFDEQAFISAFRRQAQGGLVDCLRGWRSAPAQLLVGATLLGTGTLDDIRAISPPDELPACALEYLRQMTFPAASQSLGENPHDLQWRLDW